MGIIYEEKPRQFRLYSNKISYIMTYPPGRQMGQLCYGKRMWHREGFDHSLKFAHKDMVPCVYENGIMFSLEHIKQEYPGFGTGDMRYPVYGTRRENRSRVSSFVYKSHVMQKGKPELPGLPVAYVEQDEGAWTLKLYLEGPAAGVELVLFYTIYEKVSMLTRNTRFVCRGPELAYLGWVMSLGLDLLSPRYQMVDLTEAWYRERYADCHELHQGVQSIYSMRGYSSHQFSLFIYLKWPDAGEDSDEAISISLVYSGNFLAQTEVDTMETVRVTTGVHPKGFDWPLYPGEEFQTPEAVVVYSGDGLNGMSQMLHQFYWAGLARGYQKDRERPILINNWGATFMDFDEDKILSIADRTGELGIELFVLDDGWFGRRDGDITSLGDQYPDLHKPPGGITGLAGEIRDMGIKFDLRFEPEMVSGGSRLCRAHPDQMLGSMDRLMCTGRHQYVLNFPKDQVVEHIGDRMEEILGGGGVSHVKWDINRSISGLFLAGRDAQCQRTVYHRQILGIYKLYDRLTRSFPHVLSESCVSGDTRLDPGILYYAPRGWVSDDIDGVERVKVQYGASLVYPFSSMESHVSTIPNHQTQRNAPPAAKAAATYSGTFRYKLDLNLFVEREQYQVRKQTWLTREHRKLIQQGRLYRLMSPSEGNEVAQVMVSGDADEAIVAYFRFLQPVNIGFKWLTLKGPNSGIMYRVNEVSYIVYGDELVGVGLILPDDANDARTSSVPQGDCLSRPFLAETQPWQERPGGLYLTSSFRQLPKPALADISAYVWPNVS